MKKRVIEFILFLNFITLVASGPMQLWTFELLELTTFSNDTDWVDLNLNVIRLGRGKYGFSGFVNIKKDLDNNITGSGSIERSKYRDGPYKKFPMKVENETLTNGMNMFYKPLLQPDAQKCCINAPIVEGKFEAPLTKRYVQVNRCALSTDNLPNVIMEGYYKFRLESFGPIKVVLESISLVESKTSF